LYWMGVVDVRFAMMRRNENADAIDPALAARVAALSPGGQRWLKTAIHTIRTITDSGDEEPGSQAAPGEQSGGPVREPAPSGLEDVITGKVDLKDLEGYPELDKELEGLGEIIDMLRGLGEARRKRGEEILREEILGQPPEKPEPDDDDRPREVDDEDFSF